MEVNTGAGEGWEVCVFYVIYVYIEKDKITRYNPIINCPVYNVVSSNQTHDEVHSIQHYGHIITSWSVSCNRSDSFLIIQFS
jgi:hypothetical protein